MGGKLKQHVPVGGYFQGDPDKCNCEVMTGGPTSLRSSAVRLLAGNRRSAFSGTAGPIGFLDGAGLYVIADVREFVIIRMTSRMCTVLSSRRSEL